MNSKEKLERFYHNKWYGENRDRPLHNYDPKCLCKHCVAEDVRLRLHAQADNADEARLRERFGIIPKVYRR